MHDEARNLRQEIRDRCLESSRRRQQILVLAEKAYDIHHANLPNTPALITTTVVNGSFRIVVAIPYTDGGFVGVLES